MKWEFFLQERWRPWSSSLSSCCVHGGRLFSVSAAEPGLWWSGTPVQTRWGSYWTCGHWSPSHCRLDGPGTARMNGTWEEVYHRFIRTLSRMVYYINRVIIRTSIRKTKTAIGRHLLRILRCTVFRMIILSAQSLRKSDIFCFSRGFISCFAITLRWSHEALQRRSIWHRFSWSWSKSTWGRGRLEPWVPWNILNICTVRMRPTFADRVMAPISE